MKTKKELKEIGLEMWDFFRKNPHINSKEYLPKEIFDKIEYLINLCPLCEIFYIPGSCCPDCFACPLKNCKQNSLYISWKEATTDSDRAKYANKIYHRIFMWDIGDNPRIRYTNNAFIGVVTVCSIGNNYHKEEFLACGFQSGSFKFITWLKHGIPNNNISHLISCSHTITYYPVKIGIRYRDKIN